MREKEKKKEEKAENLLNTCVTLVNQAWGGLRSMMS
jgi:hypothetical protein